MREINERCSEILDAYETIWSMTRDEFDAFKLGVELGLRMESHEAGPSGRPGPAGWDHSECDEPIPYTVARDVVPLFWFASGSKYHVARREGDSIALCGRRAASGNRPVERAFDASDIEWRRAHEWWTKPLAQAGDRELCFKCHDAGAGSFLSEVTQ